MCTPTILARRHSPDREKLRHRLGEMDESELREKLRLDLFGGPGNPQRAIAEAHLEARTAEREAQHRTTDELGGHTTALLSYQQGPLEGLYRNRSVKASGNRVYPKSDRGDNEGIDNKHGVDALDELRLRQSL